MRKVDVAVIGGGIAGLVAANDLARAGKSVIVLEKSAQKCDPLYSRRLAIDLRSASGESGPRGRDRCEFERRHRDRA